MKKSRKTGSALPPPGEPDSEALGQRDEARAEERLIRRGDHDDTVRGNAAKDLREIGNPRALDRLVRALGDSDKSVRSKATLALGKLGDSRAVEPLMHHRDPHPPGCGQSSTATPVEQ